jgi:hypothetical protein
VELARRRTETIPTTTRRSTIMNYLLMLTYRPGEGPQEGTPEFDAEMKVWNSVTDEMRAAGVLTAVSGLRVDSATTVRTKDGETTITDGPYAETKEVLFSFYIIDVEDLDAATAWAAKMPAAAYGSVDIRPTHGFESA